MYFKPESKGRRSNKRSRKCPDYMAIFDPSTEPVLPSRAEAVHDLSGRCMQLLSDRSRRLDNLNFALRSSARSIATFYSASSFDIGLLAKVGLRPERLQVADLPNYTAPAGNRVLSDRYCSLPTNNSKSVKVKWQLSSDT